MRETACSMPGRSMKGITVATAPVTSSMRSIHVKDNVFNKAKKDSQFFTDGRQYLTQPQIQLTRYLKLF
jgi:hypothetical protein